MKKKNIAFLIAALAGIIYTQATTKSVSVPYHHTLQILADNDNI